MTTYTARSYEQTKEQALRRLERWYKRSQIPYTGLRRTRETYEAEMGLAAAGIAIEALKREVKAEKKAEAL